MSKYYFGNKVSATGIKKGYVDYDTFSKAFQHVEATELYYTLCSCDHEKIVNDGINDSLLDEMCEQLWNFESKIQDLRVQGVYTADVESAIEDLQAVYDSMCCDIREPKEINAWYIVEPSAVPHLKRANEIVVYFEENDVYMWGVTFGNIGWEYAITDIKLDEEV